eukprot:1140769-Pelagomonas_calceolata.AAC.3
MGITTWGFGQLKDPRLIKNFNLVLRGVQVVEGGWAANTAIQLFWAVHAIMWQQLEFHCSSCTGASDHLDLVQSPEAAIEAIVKEVESRDYDGIVSAIHSMHEAVDDEVSPSLRGPAYALEAASSSGLSACLNLMPFFKLTLSSLSACLCLSLTHEEGFEAASLSSLPVRLGCRHHGDCAHFIE